MKIRIAGTVNDSVVDGPGIRFTVFTQGCPHNCKGCHNLGTHSYDGGHFVDTDDLIGKMKKNPLCSGLTVSGGEPFVQCESVGELCRAAKENGYNVIVYTGYRWEELLKDKNRFSVLEYVDYVIDGEFKEELKSLNVKFRGSTNQRIVNVKKSIEQGICVEEEI